MIMIVKFCNKIKKKKKILEYFFSANSFVGWMDGWMMGEKRKVGR